MLKRLWREDEGVLTFEWIMLLTLLVIGVIGGVAGIRDAIIHEAAGVAGAIVSLDQSYTVSAPVTFNVQTEGSTGQFCNVSAAQGSSFADFGSGIAFAQSSSTLSTTAPCILVP